MTEPTPAQIEAARGRLRDCHPIFGTIPDEAIAAALTAAAEVGPIDGPGGTAAAEVDDEVCITTHLWQSTGSGGSMGKQVRCDHCGKTKYIPW